MQYRGKPLNDAILRVDTERGDFRYIVAEPGDATRYELLIASLDHTVAKMSNQLEGSLIVSCLNLTGEPRSMFVRPGRLHWQDIREGLGISAEGSCYFITVLLSWIYPRFACMSEEEFQASYEAWLRNIQRKV